MLLHFRYMLISLDSHVSLCVSVSLHIATDFWEKNALNEILLHFIGYVCQSGSRQSFMVWCSLADNVLQLFAVNGCKQKIVTFELLF